MTQQLFGILATASSPMEGHHLSGVRVQGKPDIEYRFFDHVRYVEGFVEKLGLKNLTLVIHDWGSALGFHYAMRHESNVAVTHRFPIEESQKALEAVARLETVKAVITPAQ